MHRQNGKHLSWAAKSAAVLLAFALFAFNYSDIMRGVRDMPSAYYAEDGSALAQRLGSEAYPAGLTLKAVAVSSSKDQTLGECGYVECRLFGLPVKRAKAYLRSRASLVPGGLAVGVSIYTEGVLVVGLGSFEDESGAKVSPASEAGLRAGDVILSAADVQVSDSSGLQQVIEANPNGLELLINRRGTLLRRFVTPAKSGSGCRIGAWIRDSTVGVGTLSFYDEQTGAIAALGHAVVDADTETLLSVKDGRLVLAQVIGVSRGAQGSPGELHGTFDSSSVLIGDVRENTELGIYGKAADSALVLLSGEALPVAFPDEVHTGEATLLATVDANGVAAYSCRIIKTGVQNEPAQKGLVLQITDPLLLETTGGIVQGMSGSPILQDGMLVGVVTHVFVNDPQKGYGAYAYWMYDALP